MGEARHEPGPAADPSASSERATEIARALAVVRERVSRACAASGRDVGELTIVAVTKGFPASDAAAVARLGVRDLGESRDQEAARKAAELAATVSPPVRWHFVGRLQRNKCPSVARYAAVVHSVDRPGLVTALDDAAVAAGRTVTALVQVSLDGDTSRGGCPPAVAVDVADAVAASRRLRLGGVMAVAPMGADPDAAYARLRETHQEVLRRHPAATTLSAGMSGDLEAAVRHGATCLRVGSALFGVRPAPVG